MRDEYGLTEMQRRLGDYFLESGNATDAAIKAGYSEKNARFTASKNLAKPAMKRYLAARLKELAAHRIADAEEVLRFLSSSMRGEVKEEVVVVEGMGDGCSSARIMKKQIGAKDRIQAANLLAKRYGLDKPDEESGENNITFTFNREVKKDGD